jgi:hypothetical protein
VGAVIYLGNHSPVEVTRDPDDTLIRTALDGKLCTTVGIPDDWSTAETIQALTHPSGVWAWHSDADKPAWVASDDPALAQVLSALWGCELREPDPAVV